MSVERIFWLVVGLLLFVFALFGFFGDGLDIEQKNMDAIQNVILGILAIGLALRAPVTRDRVL